MSYSGNPKQRYVRTDVTSMSMLTPETLSCVMLYFLFVGPMVVVGCRAEDERADQCSGRASI